MDENENRSRKSQSSDIDFIEKVRTIRISRRGFLLASAGAVGAAGLATIATQCGSSPVPAATAPAATTAPAAATSAPAAATTAPAAATAAPPAPTSAAAAKPSAPRGTPTGKFIYLNAANFLGSFNPYQHTSLQHIRMQYQCVESLTHMDPFSQKLAGHLAESWNQLDSKTLEVKLKQGIKFHNGKELTSEDVKASLEMASDSKSIWSFFIGTTIEGEIVDPYTIRLHTPKPNVTLAAGGLSCTPITPKEDTLDPPIWEKRLIGTGPFKWVSYVGEETGVELTANLEYRGGPPYIKDVVLRYVSDTNTRLAAIKSGQASVTDRLEPEQFDVVNADPNLYSFSLPANEFKSLWFRMKKEPLASNQKLRQAIAYGIDRDAIVTSIMRGAGFPVEGQLYPGVTLYSPAKNYPTYDPEKAKQLLAEAGYPNGEGLRELEYVTSVGGYQKSKEYGEVIVEMMKAIGIKFKLNPMEIAAWVGILSSQDVGDMIDGGFFSPAMDQETHMRSLYSSGQLYSGDKDAGIDALFDEEAGEVDLDKRKEKLAKLNDALTERLPGFALLQSSVSGGVEKKVKNFIQLPNSIFPLYYASIEG